MKYDEKNKVLYIKLEQVDEFIIDSYPDLKIIASQTTGKNHVDVVYAKSKGIKCIFLDPKDPRMAEISSTAEHTFGLILSLARNYNYALQHATAPHERYFYKGIELKGKTLGIVGIGRIGKMVENYGRAFGMNILYHDINNGVELEYLLQNSDFITVHIPLNSKTKNMFKSRHFNLMKPTAYFINTSRGEIIKKGVLEKVLWNRIIAGVAIDVMWDEYDEDLMKYAQEHDNIIITNHIAGCTVDGLEKSEKILQSMVNETVDNLLD